MSDFQRRREITLDLNGETRTKTVPSGQTLLQFLREDLGLTGTTEGCGVGVCGSCTVLLDGKPVSSCQELAVNADGKPVTSVEGVGGEELSPVQAAYRDEEGFQCGYCTPGMIVMTTALLEENPDPTREELREYMSENLCRCTGYESIENAIDRAASATDELG